MRSALAVLALLAVLGSACKNKDAQNAAPAQPDPEAAVLMTVNGKEITQGDVNFWLMRGHTREFSQEEKDKVLDRLVEAELIYQQGVKLGLDKDPRYLQSLKRQEMQLRAMQRGEMLRMVHNQEVLAKIQISEEEAKKFFDENVALLKTEWHLASLVFPDATKAQEALTQIKGGKKFDDVAKTLPGPPMSQQNRPAWDLGFMDWIRIPSEWQNAVFALKPGEVSGVVLGERTGIRIFRLIAKRENEKADYGMLRGGIMMRLRESRMEDAFKKYKDELRKSATIKKP